MTSYETPKSPRCSEQKLWNIEVPFWRFRVPTGADYGERGRHNDAVQPVHSLATGTESEGSRRMDRVTRSSDPHISTFAVQHDNS